MISKIVSGGQTGVDRAALDVAIELDVAHGGWCPLGRLAEDGVIPDCYDLQETPQRDYAVRTEQNIVDSDGSLIFHRGKLTGGTLLTVKLARKHNRPCLVVDVAQGPDFDSFRNWCIGQGIHVLNVAGPRASSDPELYPLVCEILSNWLRSL